MQMIQPTHLVRPARGPLVVSTLVGALLLVGGITLAYVAFATPVVQGIAPTVIRPSTGQMLFGAAVWGLSMVAPPCFAIVGVIRLAMVGSSLMRRTPAGPLSGAIPSLGDEYVAAPTVRLPDGRVIRNIVVGPFGVAVVGVLPPPSASRRHGTTWEVRRADGRWTPLENPLERAARDAERIRHFIATEDRDFLVKVYAAVVVGNTGIARTATCAAISGDQVPGWLASLPAQRSLNAERRADIVEMIRSVA